MITLAQLIVDRAEAGASVLDEFTKLPAYQLRERFEDLAPLCPSRRCLPIERRPGNALNVEIGAPLPRCAMRSPDGRGLAWLLSGGSLLAYGTCDRSRCPRLVTPPGAIAKGNQP